MSPGLRKGLIKLYGDEVSLPFERALRDSEFGELLDLPLLSPARRSETLNEISLSKVPFEKLRRLTLSNGSQTDATIECRPDFNQCVDARSLYRFFCRCTVHAHSLGDFRFAPHLYAPILKGADFFSYFGDGNCIALGLLFSGLGRSLLGSSIEPRYVQLAEPRFSHVHCVVDQGGKKRYLDPDLKADAEFDRLQEADFPGWWYYLVTHYGLVEYYSLSESDRQAYFPMVMRETRTRLYLDRSDSWQARGVPYPSVRAYLNRALRSFSEVLDPLSDDYDWKGQYRAAVRESFAESADPFEFDRDSVSILRIPSGGTLEFGSTPPDDYRQLVDVLQTVYFGKALARLTFRIADCEQVKILLPTLPWFIVVDESSSLHFEGRTIGVGRRPGQWTMGELDELFEGQVGGRLIEVRGNAGQEASVYFPINAAFWNSRYISLSHEHGAQLSARAEIAE